jgi:DNA gyrase subunit B
MGLLEDPLRKWVNKNKALAKDIAQRATNIKAAREEARQITRAAAALSGAKRRKQTGTKLTYCNKKCPAEQIELFLVEGDSAGGNAIKARNPFYQEVLKCRGKGLNVIKATFAKALDNDEVRSLLEGLGADPQTLKKGDQLTQFRIGKLCLFSDADIDGKHIDLLWITLVYRFAPVMFERGMVYKVNVPLYIMEGNYDVYGFTLEEIKSKMNPKDYPKITRAKGLGELNEDQLAPFMNPETRSLTRITLPQAKKSMDEFIKLMGNDTAVRKQLLNIEARA